MDAWACAAVSVAFVGGVVLGVGLTHDVAREAVRRGLSRYAERCAQAGESYLKVHNYVRPMLESHGQQELADAMEKDARSLLACKADTDEGRI